MMEILNRVSESIKNIFVNKKDILFERKDLAKKFLSIYDEATFSLIIYEARRKGKTTFVLRDLAKEAMNNHYVFYYSFMKSNKKEDFLEEFRKFVIEVILKEEQFFKKINFDFSLNLNELLKIEIKNKEKKDNQIMLGDINLTTFSDINRVIKEYSSLPIMLIFDEFQELGRAKNLENSLLFLKELRTVLDTSRTIYKTIFLGSSIEDINKMFSDYSQPFFNFGLKIKLPDLEEDFLIHLKDYFLKEKGIKLNLEEMKKIYNKMGKLPGVMLDLLKIASINGEKYNFSLTKIFNQQKLFEQNFRINDVNINKLTLLDKIILKRIVLNNEKITSSESVSFIQNFSKDLENINVNKIRNRIRKLKEQDIISKEGQKWFINNKMLEEYILNEI